MTTNMLLTKPKVLAVDDDTDLLRLLELSLERAGFEVGLASNGASALEYVDAEHPDLLVLDLMMPEMDGFTVLEHLKDLDRPPRVVCLTARVDSKPRERAWRLGVDEYVTKPFGLKRIVEVLQNVARRDWAPRESRRQTALDQLSWT